MSSTIVSLCVLQRTWKCGQCQEKGNGAGAWRNHQSNHLKSRVAEFKRKLNRLESQLEKNDAERKDLLEKVVKLKY